MLLNQKKEIQDYKLKKRIVRSLEMNKKTFWILASTYAAITFIFNHVLHTAFGAFLMTLSYFGLAFALISFIYLLIHSFLRPFFYNRKKGPTDK